MTSIPSHNDSSSRSRQPITIVSTDQGPRVGPYIFGRTLGTGSTGKVKLAKNLITGEIVAIKIVRKDYLDHKPSLKKKMRREISVLKVLSHPNLMSLIDVFEIETHLFLVMEFVDGLELFEYLVRRGALPIHQALSFFQQIICGLEYCHQRLICHRDLKPENLLLDRNLNIKIADFGMTSLSPPDMLLETSCGSPHYCDPMVVSGEMYDGLKADIWSCGVILYAMVTGRLPFDDDNIQRLLNKVQAGHYHMPTDLPKDLRDLIRRMLNVDPSQRITLEGIKAHPWFNSIPPRNYVSDKFVIPNEPIVDPDPLIMRSLVDLGWGDANAVSNALSKVGPSMEKVFYEQLEKHPMYRRVRRTPTVDHHPAPQQQHQRQQQQPPLNVPERHESVSNPSSTTAANNGHGRSGGHPDAEDLRRRMESLAVAANGRNGGTTETTQSGDGADESPEASPSTVEQGDGRGAEEVGGEDGEDAKDLEKVVPKSGSGTLVRQSSLRGMSEIGGVGEHRDDRVEEAIKNITVGPQKSWFDSMRIMLSGQHRDEDDGNNSQTGTEGGHDVASGGADQR